MVKCRESAYILCHLVRPESAMIRKSCSCHPGWGACRHSLSKLLRADWCTDRRLFSSSGQFVHRWGWMRFARSSPYKPLKTILWFPTGGKRYSHIPVYRNLPESSKQCGHLPWQIVNVLLWSRNSSSSSAAEIHSGNPDRRWTGGNGWL